ncbi:MAG: hypothetical protein ACLPXZ_02145 [Mycobacterium sp.]
MARLRNALRAPAGDAPASRIATQVAETQLGDVDDDVTIITLRRPSASVNRER